jgi:transcriptional regulator with XRE-family HTH domain
MIGITERFAGNLKRCRKQSWMSQEALAARASLHRTEIGKLENAERLPRLDTLVKLAGAMSIPAERLLDGIVWTPGHSEEGRFVFSSAGPLLRTGQNEPK